VGSDVRQFDGLLTEDYLCGWNWYSVFTTSSTEDPICSGSCNGASFTS
jgi:hypothetical protein